MCSRRWEMPVIPAVSFRDPTRYQTMNAATGAVWTSWISTERPLSSTVSVTEEAGAAVLVLDGAFRDLGPALAGGGVTCRVVSARHAGSSLWERDPSAPPEAGA